MNYLTSLDGFAPKTEIYIYGAGGAGEKLFHEAGRAGVRVKGFIDSFKDGELQGLPVVRFDEFAAAPGHEDASVVIACHKDTEVAAQLDKAGVRDYASYKDIDRYILCRTVEGLLPEDEKYALLDIGARDFLETTFWLPLNRSRLKLFGFDADREESDRINREAREKGQDYTCFPIALWSEPGKRTFYHIPELGENSSFYPHQFETINRWKVSGSDGPYDMGGAMRHVQEIEMDMDTLDNWKRDSGIKAVDFAKLNIEGAELPVLQGGKDVMAGMLGVMAEASMVDFNRPMFAELDTFIRSQGFEFFDFWVSNTVGRNASPVSVELHPSITYKTGQRYQTYPVYFRDPIRMEQRGMDLGMFDRTRLLKLVGLAETFLQIEYAFEVLAWTADFLEARGEDVSDIRAAFDRAAREYGQRFA